MSVKLLYSTPLWLISNGIRYSHHNHNLSDTENINTIGSKDYDLIKRIGFHLNHSSTLEHSLITFDIKLSTKALLEFTRHRVGIAYTVTSSRYALDTMGIEFEQTGNKTIDDQLTILKKDIDFLLKHASKKDFDNLAMLLPQAFMYKMQVSFNLRSLVHFLELRTNKSAHYSIRKTALEIIDVLPDDYKELVLLNEKINKEYTKYKENYNEK